jgi:hypothetical protein
MTEETKVAKVPPGMEIKRPKSISETKPLINVKDFDLDPNLPIIQYPHYTNNAKTELACLLVRPDGAATKESRIPRDEKHPLYRDIKRQFTEEEIVINTQREVQISKAMTKSLEEKKAQDDREMIRSKLWEIKSTFMDMDEVKNSENKTLKRNLRKATSYYQALAYGCAIIIEESNKSE